MVFLKKGMISIDLLELYYKKYTHTVKAADYVEWANHYLYLGTCEIIKWSSMRGQLNSFEIEDMFAHAMKSIQREAPSIEMCLDYHLKCLHSKLLVSMEDAILIVKEIYECTIAHDLFEEQMNRQEISDAIDDFKYGDNQNHYTLDKINNMITTHARRLWHTKISKTSFKEFNGQKITAIESKPHFTIELEKGAIIVECPWRIRDAGGILLGETDIKSNQREWKAAKELLIGKTIDDIQLLEQCPLLIVQCSNLFLDLFHDSSFFDGWTLTDEEDFYMFSMHGGSIA